MSQTEVEKDMQSLTAEDVLNVQTFSQNHGGRRQRTSSLRCSSRGVFGEQTKHQYMGLAQRRMLDR